MNGAWWHQLGYDLLTGNAEYHLYFLLVTLQIYLIFPLLLRLIRTLQGHHGLLFGSALVFEIAETWALRESRHVSMRMAAHGLSVQRVAEAAVIRGLYP